MGLLLHAIVHPADIQDRDGGILYQPSDCLTLCKLVRAILL